MRAHAGVRVRMRMCMRVCVGSCACGRLNFFLLANNVNNVNNLFDKRISQTPKVLWVSEASITDRGRDCCNGPFPMDREVHVGTGLKVVGSGVGSGVGRWCT